MHRYFAWLACSIVALGGFLFGYDWVVIGGAKPFYEAYFRITDGAWYSSWAMSSALLGCLLGAISSGLLAERFGRKPALLVTACLFAASAVWTANATNYTSFVLSRILGGIAIGIASSVSPMYIAELSPAAIRGRLVGINQLAIVLGILAAQLINLLIYNYETVPDVASTESISNSWSGRIGWRLMFSVETIPALAFFGLLFLVPESPRWLVLRRRYDCANNVLSKIGSADLAREEIADIRQSLVVDAGEVASGKSKLPSRALMIGLVLAFFQQWCGLNVVFNYAEEIFVAAGFSISSLMLNIVITGAVNLVFTLLAIRYVDRLGRRPLMLVGAGGLALIYAFMGSCYFFQLSGILVLLGVLLAIALYASTLGPVTWILLSEMFPNRHRSIAMSICVSALWIGCFLLTITFKPLNSSLGPAFTFWIYGAICVAGLLFFAKTLPETKGVSLESMDSEIDLSDSPAHGRQISVTSSQ
jgi:SP family sugar porter-like MFS transporter